jgi:recombination protein RecR
LLKNPLNEIPVILSKNRIKRYINVMYPSPLVQLIAALKKFPGVGKKSAERFAFKMISWSDKEIKDFVTSIENVKNKLHSCQECGALVEIALCPFCNLQKRDTSILCVVSSAKDIFALEEMRIFNGLYHVLGTLLSPLERQFEEKLHLGTLLSRIQTAGVKEVILALDSTLEGDATALFIRNALRPLEIRISRLALGLPLGSSLDFVDEGTLSRAFTGRSVF